MAARFRRQRARAARDSRGLAAGRPVQPDRSPRCGTESRDPPPRHRRELPAAPAAPATLAALLRAADAVGGEAARCLSLRYGDLEQPRGGERRRHRAAPASPELRAYSHALRLGAARRIPARRRPRPRAARLGGALRARAPAALGRAQCTRARRIPRQLGARRAAHPEGVSARRRGPLSSGGCRRLPHARNQRGLLPDRIAPRAVQAYRSAGRRVCLPARASPHHHRRRSRDAAPALESDAERRIAGTPADVRGARPHAAGARLSVRRDRGLRHRDGRSAGLRHPRDRAGTRRRGGNRARRHGAAVQRADRGRAGRGRAALRGGPRPLRRGPLPRKCDALRPPAFQAALRATRQVALGALMNRTLLVGIAATSAALLMTELALTRIFSVTMFYHFAFLAISIALFGVSASGVFAYVTRRRLERYPTDTLLAAESVIYAVSTIVALFWLVRLRVGLNYSPHNLALMLAIYALAALPFFAGGLVVTLAISLLSPQLNAVYPADLIGPAAGCLTLIPLLDRLGGPRVVLSPPA